MAKAQKDAAQKNIKANGILNPYREGGSYWAVVETLKAMGIGKMHDGDKVVAKYPSIIGAEAWKAFKAKDKRNDETGKEAAERVIQNCTVVNRLDYGLPLRKAGAEVRKAQNTFGLFKLTPAETKAAGKTVITRKPRKAVPSKPQTARKASGAKGKATTAPTKQTAAKRKAAEDAVLKAFNVDLIKGTIDLKPKKAKKAK